jgi:hypothetical protein
VRWAGKDAAAQTDLTPKPKDGIVEHRGRLNESVMTREAPIEGQRLYANVGPLDRVIQSAPQALLDSKAERRLTRLAQDAVYADPQSGFRQYGGGSQDCGLGDELAAVNEGAPYAFIDQSMYDSALNPVGFGHGRERDGESFLDLYAMPAEQTICADQYNSWDRNPHQPGDLGAVPGNFGFENLEDFIRRIEGEAAVPLVQREDDWAPPTSGFGVSDWRGQRQVGLCDVANLDGADDRADDAAIPFGRQRSRLETELFPPASAGHPAPFHRTVGFDCLTSLSTREPYLLQEQDGPMTKLWQQRDML